jgi:hypothetical protein
MKKIQILAKITAIGLFFVAPCMMIFSRYSKEAITETRTVEITNPLGIMPTIFLGVIFTVVLWFVMNQFMEMLRQNKFGWLSIIFFGLVLGTILYGSWFMINSILVSVQDNVDTFLANMEYHRDTLHGMLWFITAGVGVSVLAKIMEFKIPTP